MSGVDLRALARRTGLAGKRTLGALALAGVLGAVMFLLLAGTAPLGGLAALLYPVAGLIPLLGVCFAVLAALAMWRSRSRGLPPELAEAESPASRVAGRLGTELSGTLQLARSNRYTGETTSVSERIRGMLVRAARRAVRTREGLDESGAQAAVESGSWTDDPVAAAVCSGTRRLPLVERLRGVVDPGRAYQRRVDRTLDAIDRLNRSGDISEETRGESAPDGSESETSDRDAGTEDPPAGTGDPPAVAGNRPDTDDPLTETVFEGQLGAGVDSRLENIWGGLVAVLLVGAGLAAGRPVLVVAATTGLLFLARGALAGPASGSLELTRRLSLESGDPGDQVTVETTVRNTGEEPLVDLRVVDGVPGELPVRSGSPEACVSLAPGETKQLTYDLELRRGEFSFGLVALRRTSLTGLASEQWAVGGEGEQTVRCLPAVERVPLGGATNDYAGAVATDEGGRGVEFYSVREYEAGDPVRSIDWRRYAHTRDLATVEFRAERATRVVCLVDCRETEQMGASETRLPARDISVAAARRTVDALFGAGHPTGLAAIEETGIYQVDPATDRETRTTIDEVLDAQLDGNEPESGRVRLLPGNPSTTLPATLPGETQVFLFSSLVDDVPVDLTAQLRSRGFAVTVISPDVTAGVDDTAVRLAGLERDDRLVRTRAASAQVLDWDAGQPLVRVLNRAIRGVTTA
jgi:uncharacterized repeat protein (TIGR01451 family)